MILIVDDDRQFAECFAAFMREAGHDACATFSASGALAAVRSSRSPIECVVLDVMLPGGAEFSRGATNNGKSTGLQLFAAIRAVLADVPVFVVTALASEQISRWLIEQDACQIWHKPFEFGDLACEIDKTLNKMGVKLLQRLNACRSGHSAYRKYEQICADLLSFLFVPPLPAVHLQSRTADGHEVRDAILVNAEATGFWNAIRNEFESVNIPCEFKNYRSAIGTKEVQQLRLRLDKPSLGRFGILFSRKRPNKGALAEQRLAYSSFPKKLILFVDDTIVASMVTEKERKGRPESVLQRLKTEFELRF